MEAIASAAKAGNFAVSFRSAGPATLRRLAQGAAAKGHDILEKTVKESSVAAAYGSDSGRIMAQLRGAGLDGYVGHWGKEGLKGIYVTSDILDRAPALASVLKEIPHEQGQAQPALKHPSKPKLYYPIDLNDLEGSLKALKSVPNWESLGFSGDYDMHEIISFSGHQAPVPSDSADEMRIIGKMNKAIAVGDAARPLHKREQWVVQHGPQASYVAHMLALESSSALTGAVAKPSFPLAMCDRGDWSVIESMDQLLGFYQDRGLHIKETWKPDGSMQFEGIGSGQVRLSRVPSRGN